MFTKEVGSFDISLLSPDFYLSDVVEVGEVKYFDFVDFPGKIHENRIILSTDGMVKKGRNLKLSTSNSARNRIVIPIAERPITKNIPYLIEGGVITNLESGYIVHVDEKKVALSELDRELMIKKKLIDKYCSIFYKYSHFLVSGEFVFVKERELVFNGDKILNRVTRQIHNTNCKSIIFHNTEEMEMIDSRRFYYDVNIDPIIDLERETIRFDNFIIDYNDSSPSTRTMNISDSKIRGKINYIGMRYHCSVEGDKVVIRELIPSKHPEYSKGEISFEKEEVEISTSSIQNEKKEMDIGEMMEENLSLKKKLSDISVIPQPVLEKLIIYYQTLKEESTL